MKIKMIVTDLDDTLLHSDKSISDETVRVFGKCRKQGIAMENIAAFGDDVNDIPMLEACGLGVAVANAGEEVKTIADKVTLSNDEDGVAYYIEKEILNHN